MYDFISSLNLAVMTKTLQIILFKFEPRCKDQETPKKAKFFQLKLSQTIGVGHGQSTHLSRKGCKMTKMKSPRQESNLRTDRDRERERKKRAKETATETQTLSAAEMLFV